MSFIQPGHWSKILLVFVLFSVANPLSAQRIIRLKISDLESTDTIAKYTPTIQNFIKTDNPTEFDSYLLITSGRALSSIELPTIIFNPTDTSDISGQRFIERYDTLMIGYNHPDTTFLIDGTIRTQGRLKDNCIIEQRFTYDFKNVAPNIEDQSFAVDENISEGSLLGQIVATDADENNLIYRLLNTSQRDLIKLDSLKGEVSLTEGNSLDYEAFPAINLQVEVDDGWIRDTAFVRININDLNEAPFGTEAFSKNLNENPSEGAVVATLDPTDPDGDELSFEIVSSEPENAFEVNSQALQVVVADPDLFNFEERSELTATIEASDGEFSYSINISVSLNNINEAPLTSNYAFSIDDTVAIGKLIGVVEATDPEGNEVSYSIASGNTDNLFEIDEVSGEIRLQNEIGRLTDDKDYTLQVGVSDGAKTGTSTVDITIERVIVASIEDPLPGVKVYPNPVSSILKIDIPVYQAASTKITLRDTNGKTLNTYRGDQVIDSGLDLSQIPTGFYLVQIRIGLLEKVVKIQKIQ